jgi:hypothetical protein
MTSLDAGIVLFGFATMVWLGDISQYLSKKFPRFVFLSALPVFVFTIATMEYVLVRYADQFPPGFVTFLFVLDNALGQVFLASLALIGSFYLLYPWLKMSRAMLPKHVANEIALLKPPPIKGSGAVYIYINFVLAGLMAVALFTYLRPVVFGNSCEYSLDVFCVRISVFVQVVSTSLNLGNFFAKSLVAVGTLAPSLGVVKVTLEIFKQVKEAKENNQDVSEKEILTLSDE